MNRNPILQVLVLLALLSVSLSAGSQDEASSDIARPQSSLTKAIQQCASFDRPDWDRVLPSS